MSTTISTPAQPIQPEEIETEIVRRFVDYPELVRQRDALRELLDAKEAYETAVIANEDACADNPSSEAAFDSMVKRDGAYLRYQAAAEAARAALAACEKEGK